MEPQCDKSIYKEALFNETQPRSLDKTQIQDEENNKALVISETKAKAIECKLKEPLANRNGSTSQNQGQCSARATLQNYRSFQKVRESSHMFDRVQISRIWGPIQNRNTVVRNPLLRDS